jgi:hypothetical protein
VLPAPAQPPAPPVVEQGPPVSRYYVPPPPAGRVPPPPASADPLLGADPRDVPPARPDIPPVTGSNYRSVPPLAPVPPQQLTPPLPPPGVRLERIASQRGRRTQVQGRLLAANKNSKDADANSSSGK